MKSLVVGTVGSKLMWIKLLDGLYELTLRLKKRKRVFGSKRDVEEFYELIEECTERERW